jgi:hypothetical protein
MGATGGRGGRRSSEYNAEGATGENEDIKGREERHTGRERPRGVEGVARKRPRQRDAQGWRGRERGWEGEINDVGEKGIYRQRIVCRKTKS